MIRLLVVLLALAVSPSLWGQKINLYLKDGGDLIVREYEVEGERVRYYSVERRNWEEIPLELVDLEKTRREEEREAAWRAKREEQDRIERAARRKARTELHRVPLEDGVYYLRGEKIEELKQAQVQVQGNKTRTLLSVMVPIVLGKQTMELDGKVSEFVCHDERPTFYVRLEKITRLMMVRLKDKKKSRVVQKITKAPKNSGLFEEQDEVEVFRQQLAPTVYKVWPVNPIPPGNYALIDYTPGEADVRVWDFTLRAPEAAASGS